MVHPEIWFDIWKLKQERREAALERRRAQSAVNPIEVSSHERLTGSDANSAKELGGTPVVRPSTTGGDPYPALTTDDTGLGRRRREARRNLAEAVLAGDE